MEQVGYLERPQDASQTTLQDTLSVWWSHHGQRVWWLSVLGMMCGTCLEQVRLVTRASRFTNGDHAVLWLAARHWSELDIREPTFFGQGYGVTFESIPVALLHALGVPYSIGLQASLVSMAVLAYWWLGWCARRRGLQLASLAAFAWPLLVSYQHFCVVDVIGTGVGRLFAAGCAGLVLRERMTRGHVALAVASGGFASVIDGASMLLAGPALVWAGLRWLRSPRLWWAAGAGLLLPLGWLGLNAWFNRAHPDHLWHQGWSYEPVATHLLENLRDPDRLLGAQGPELYPHGALILATFLAALLLALAFEAWREAAAVGCVIAQLLLLFSLEKSFDARNSLWFPAARMTLCTPMTAWFVLTITLRATLEPLQQRVLRAERLRLRALTAAASISLLLLSAASCGVRALEWSPRMRDFIRSGYYDPFIPIKRVTELKALCRDVKRTADAGHTDIVVFPDGLLPNYACAALHPGLNTIYPYYERRWWVLDELASVPRERMLLWGVDPALCSNRSLKKRLKQCTPVGEEAVLVAFNPQPPLAVLRTLDISTRPFGRDCDPAHYENCATWKQRFRAPNSVW